MIRHNGYRVEIHKVVTSDDYVLTLHRVLPSNDESTSRRHGTPIILQHGVLADSTCWMCNGPEHSFAFILVDAGYLNLYFFKNQNAIVYKIQILETIYTFSELY